MLHRSLRRLTVIPNSGTDMSHMFRHQARTPIISVNDDLYQYVVEFDHKKPMAHCFDSPHTATFFATKPFSGSPVAAATTAGGVFLFLLCFGYLIGKPVVDAHREYFSAPSGDSDGENADSDDGPSPVEEEGNDMQ